MMLESQPRENCNHDGAQPWKILFVHQVSWRTLGFGHFLLLFTHSLPCDPGLSLDPDLDPPKIVVSMILRGEEEEGRKKQDCPKIVASMI